MSKMEWNEFKSLEMKKTLNFFVEQIAELEAKLESIRPYNLDKIYNIASWIICSSFIVGIFMDLPWQ